jgi:hypothetical protein
MVEGFGTETHIESGCEKDTVSTQIFLVDNIVIPKTENSEI